MRFFIDDKPKSSGAVIFEYKNFTISIQNNHTPSNLIVFDTETKDTMSTEFHATAEGIRDAMTLIDYYHLNQALKG